VRTEYEYDKDGNMTGVLDPLEKWTRYTYDFAGNTLSERDQLGHIEYYAYDANHNLIELTDRGASGVRGVTRYSYDRLVPCNP
jgi:YD repeat-containing protein